MSTLCYVGDSYFLLSGTILIELTFSEFIELYDERQKSSMVSHSISAMKKFEKAALEVKKELLITNRALNQLKKTPPPKSHPFKKFMR